MDFSSLPKYRALKRPGPTTSRRRTRLRVSRRLRRILIDLAILTAIAVGFHQLGQVLAAYETLPPRDLNQPIIYRTARNIPPGMAREDLLAFLGKPTSSVIHPHLFDRSIWIEEMTWKANGCDIQVRLIVKEFALRSVQAKEAWENGWPHAWPYDGTNVLVAESGTVANIRVVVPPESEVLDRVCDWLGLVR